MPVVAQFDWMLALLLGSPGVTDISGRSGIQAGDRGDRLQYQASDKAQSRVTEQWRCPLKTVGLCGGGTCPDIKVT